VAESFGSDAQRYERARPGYPEAMVTRLIDASPGRDLVAGQSWRSYAGRASLSSSIGPSTSPCAGPGPGRGLGLGLVGERLDLLQG
jgi:hypothetical protein